MASGSFIIGTTNQYVEGRCYWDAWSDPNRNVSRVNVSVYFYRTNNWSGATKGTFTFYLYSSFGEQARNTQYFSFTNPNGGQGTQVLNASWEQAHDANGELRFRLSVGKDTDVFALHNNGGDVVADKIARESTVASQPSATLPNDIWIDLNVSNSTFYHTVELWAKNTSGADTLIDTQTRVGTRADFRAVPALRQKLAQALGNRSEMALWATAVTYDANGNQIGGKRWGPEGRYYRPNLGFISCPALFVNEVIRARIGSYDSRLQYRVHVCVHMNYDGNGNPPAADTAKFRKIYTPTTEQFDISFTQAEQDKIATDTMPDRTARLVTFQVDTMCEGVVLNTNNAMPAYSNGGIDISRMNIAPTFSGSFPAVDTNSVTTAITGNSSMIIQGQSKVTVTVPAANRAVAKLGATITRYDFTINGVTVPVTPPASGNVVANFGVVNAAANTTCTVSAIDTRGMSAPVSTGVTMIPYTPPTVIGTGARQNNFEASTKVTASGSYAPLTISGQNKNDIVTKSFRSRVLGGTFNNPTGFATITKGTNTYEATTTSVIFDVDKIYEVEVTIKDKVSPEVKTTFILNKGTPIAFMDAKTQSLGVNMIPVAGNGENKLQVTGSAYVSDNVKTQVLLFPKTGAESNPSAANSQYVSFRLKDDRIMMNDKNIFYQLGNTSDLRLGGNLYTSSTQGAFIDAYGNIKPQTGVIWENTWGVFQKKSDGSYNAAILLNLVADADANRTTVTIGGVNFNMNKSPSNLAPNGAMSFINTTTNGRMTAYFENIFALNAGANPSRPEYKENLELLDISATDIINSNNVYSYDYKDEYRQPNHNTLKKDIGVLINESLSLMTNDDDTAIKDYAMSSILWKGLQEANARLTKLEEATK
ncbi:minor tail protein [Bacillus phage Belinda]|uniref:tail protein n=1 Tax=Bacillus phage Belinda TaxID=1852564 RepID=UPI0007F16241|nr:tail protein [Bacillus phage Belinda]ANM46033.1 minor tail protein [Bacillus phage Belinda]